MTIGAGFEVTGAIMYLAIERLQALKGFLGLLAMCCQHFKALLPREETPFPAVRVIRDIQRRPPFADELQREKHRP